MPAGNGVNCLYCPEREVGRCEGNDTGCLCFKCPRHLGQCRCVKYCRETESVLIFDERQQNIFNVLKGSEDNLNLFCFQKRIYYFFINIINITL